MQAEVADILPRLLTYKPATASHKPQDAVGKFERLPKWLNCIPLVLQWLWLSIIYRSLTLPTVTNPHIVSGGMVGEGKQEYFNSMGKTARAFIAPFIAVEIKDDLSFDAALALMQRNDLQFPVVVKPDVGWCGYGVKLISNAQALKNYISDFPIGQTILLQTYLPQPGEAGIFYIRHPQEENGVLLGILLRHYPRVTGDGVHTIEQLIRQDVRLSRILHNAWHQPSIDLNEIPMRGQEIRLALIGSTRIGGKYCDESDAITPALTKTIDTIAKDMPEFYVGRFDIRYESLELLREGKGFTIMEVNGAGSEAVHAWDPKYSIAQAYRIIFAKQQLLFQIGAFNRRRGHKPIGLAKLAKLHFSQQLLIKHYPLSN